MRHQVDTLRRSPALATLVAALVVAALLAAGLVGLAPAASAAPGTVSAVAVSVAQDGSAPLVAAYDDDLHNGRVATNDEIRWTVRGTIAVAGDVTYTSTLPAGMHWNATSAAATICTVTGTISADGRTWTCTRTAAAGEESFEIAARVGAVANGDAVAATVTAGAASGTAPGVTVVGESRTEVRLYADQLNSAAVYNGYPGTAFLLSVHPGVTSADGNVRGVQGFRTPLTYTVAVPPGAVVMSSSMSAGPSAGTVTTSQAAPGGDVTVTLTGVPNDFLTVAGLAGQPATYLGNGSSHRLSLFIPNDPTLPEGQVTRITTQVKGFDPVGMDGSSNFGAGYAPGQDPAYTCPATVGLGSKLACVVLDIDRRGGLMIRGNNGGATNGVTSGSYLLGDNHPYPGGNEKVVPGSRFAAHMGFGNLGAASLSATQPRACVTFDNAYLQMTARAIPKRGPQPTTAFYSGGGTPLTAGTYVLEYSAAPYASDDERRGVDCGTAGDGAPGWVTDPATLPGGLASVTGIRVASDLVLDPNVSLGMSVQFARTTSPASLALPVDAPLPWFFQYATAETPLVKSAFPSAGSSVRTDGGYVQAVPSLVRATADFSPASADPGTVATLAVNPFLVAPIGSGVDTSADDVSVSVAFDSACVSPIPATLDALVAAGTVTSYDLTPADPGPDGIACTGDDGAPASLVLHLGSHAAPGGAANLSVPGYVASSGHQVDLPVLRIGVHTSPLTPSGTTSTPRVVIAAATDSSAEYWETIGNGTDRTVFPSLVVTGVAALNGSKTAATRTPGKLSPGETFSYSILWGNGTSDESGPGTFVDLLPYDGDARGTTGLGSRGLVLDGVSAAMDNPALMGAVALQYTTDDPEDVAAALARAGNEDGATGIAWRTGTVPSDRVSALRFVMAGDLRPGFTGSATITAHAPGLGLNSVVVNDLYGRTAPVGGDPATAKSFRAVSEVELAANAAQLGGTIRRDLDFSGTVTGADDTWPAATGVVEVVDEAAGTVVATTDVSADGTYRALVAPGTYAVRLADGTHDGWTQIDPGTRTLADGESVDDFDQLYGEDIADPVLADDAAVTHLGDPVVIDVTANDTLDLPTVGPAPRDGVALGDTAPAYGTVKLTAPTGDGTQSRATYTAPSEWPAEFAGQTSFEDVFTYTWTNARGVSATATVTVTVYAALLVAPDEAETLAGTPVSIDVLANDAGAALAVTSITPSMFGTAQVEADGTVTFTPTAGYSGRTTFDYTVTDAAGTTATTTVTVTVWGPPQPPAMESSTHVDVPVTTGAWTFTPQAGATQAESGQGEAQVADPAVEFRLAAETVAVADGAHGHAELLEDGTLRYTPQAGYVGDDQVVYTVRDSAGQEATAVWTIHVLSLDQPLPEPTPGPTDTATPAPTGNGAPTGTPAPTGARLALTGASVLGLALAAAGLLGAGLVLVVRRRRTTA